MPKNVVRLPLIGMGPFVPGSFGAVDEQAIICQAICNCEKSTKASGRSDAQACVTRTLRTYDNAQGGLSTIKAEVPYDMSQNPPVPIMSKNHPGPTTGHPKGSRIPDVIIVKDPTKPPTQDNIKKVVEVKFPPDTLTADQAINYPIIAGSAPFETWTPDDPCYCRDKEKERVPREIRVEDLENALIAAALALAIAGLLLDDAAPGGQADDVLIPSLVKKLGEILSQLAPVYP
jgi:type VI secretion system secreted protein VgrG